MQHFKASDTVLHAHEGCFFCMPPSKLIPAFPWESRFGEAGGTLSCYSSLPGPGMEQLPPHAFPRPMTGLRKVFRAGGGGSYVAPSARLISNGGNFSKISPTRTGCLFKALGS